ncbi:hypothetical protein THAOC_24675, partial [Thalassiosira oceanica]
LNAKYGSLWPRRFDVTGKLGFGFHRDKRGQRYYVTTSGPYETVNVGASDRSARILNKETDSELIETIRSCVTEKAAERAAQRKRQTDPPSSGEERKCGYAFKATSYQEDEDGWPGGGGGGGEQEK